MKQDTFYNTDTLSTDKKIELMEEAKGLCNEWWVDELDCNKSWSRRKIEMSWEDAIERFRNVKGFCFFTIIKRQAFDNHFEVGYRIQDNHRDLFLWIIVPEKFSESLIDKYGLEELI